MAVGKVEQIITIKGDDQESKVDVEVQSNFAKMGERLQKAGEFFGDLERVGRGFKDVLGETASKELQDVLDKLGGMESLIIGGGKAFGPWGAAAGAAAASCASRPASMKGPGAGPATGASKSGASGAVARLRWRADAAGRREAVQGRDDQRRPAR